MSTLTSAMSSEASGEEHDRKARAAVIKTVSPARRTARVHVGVKATPASGKNQGQSGNDRKKIIGLTDCSRIGARKQDLVGSRKKTSATRSGSEVIQTPWPTPVCDAPHPVT